MLKDLKNNFNIQYLEGKVCCTPFHEGARFDPALIEKLLILKKHRTNTVHLLTKQDKKIDRVVAIDIETTCLEYEKGEIRLVSVYSPEEQYVTSDVAKVASILKDESVLKVFHNAAFDVTWLTANGYPVINYTDTMIMGQILHNKVKSSNTLQSLAFEYLNVIIDKQLQHASQWQGELTEDHMRYALKDAEITYHLYHLLRKKIEQKHLDVVLDREISMLPIVVALNINGLPLDYISWSKELEKIQDQMIQLESRVREFFEMPSLNLSSPKQLVEAFERIGILLDNAKDETLANIENTYPIITEIRQYKKLKKLVSTYGEKLRQKICKDNRIRGNWRVIGTDTSRMTCTKPNLQGLPKILKPYVKAPEGKLFVIADYSTIELRILAEITKDPSLLKAFQQGEDLHEKTARAVLAKKEDELITSDERKIGKVINFGLLYGMTEYGLQKKIQAATGKEISLDEAVKFRNRYFELYPNVLSYQNEMLKSDCIFTLGGRYWSSESTELDRGAISRYNYPIQAAGAEGLKESLKLLYPELKPDWLLIAAVHDEIILEVPSQEAEKAKQVLLHAMERGMATIIPSIPIEIDINIANHWSK